MSLGSPSDLSRYIIVLKQHRFSQRGSLRPAPIRAGMRGEEDGAQAEPDARRRQQVSESLRKAQEELALLRKQVQEGAVAARGGPADGTNLEEELRAKEEELNRIKNDYSVKMKNSLALQRIKYEREIDNLRKEIRKYNMSREEASADFTQRERDLTEKESHLRQQQMELTELRKRLEAEPPKKVEVIRLSPEMEGRVKGLENELLRQKASLDVKTQALRSTEEKLAALEAEYQDFRKASDETFKQSDLRAELDNVKKGSIAMMKYITSLQQKKQEEEFKAIRKALENEIQKRIQVEEELRRKEESLAARERALGAELERVAGSQSADIQVVKKLETELRLREEDVRQKEQAISQKEKGLVEKIKGLEGEIQKKLRDGKILQDIKREFQLKEEELNLLRTELQQKEEELARREQELATKGVVSVQPPPPGKVPKDVETELKRLRDELSFREAEFKRITEPMKYKEQEFMRLEEDLRYREEVLKKEMVRLEEARKEQATVDDTELKKRLAALEQEIKNKEEEVKSRETYLRRKEDDLRLRENKLVSKEVEAHAEDLRVEIQAEKAKTGNARLDDLLWGGIPFGSNVLCIGPAFIGKEILIARFLLEGLQKGIPALVVTTDISPNEIREEMNNMVPGVEQYEKLGLLRYIDVYSKSMGLMEEDPYTVYVDHPTDYAGITRAIEMLTKQFKEKNPTLRMAVRSISTLVTYSDPTSTYKFLQATTGRIKRAKMVSLFTLDRGMHSDTEIETLAHLMDGSIEFKTDGVKTFISVKGLTDVQSRSWIQYTYTKKGLNIGSFALDHIR